MSQYSWISIDNHISPHVVEERVTNEQQAKTLLLDGVLKRYNRDGLFQFKAHQWLDLYPPQIQLLIKASPLQLNNEALKEAINSLEPYESQSDIELFKIRQLCQSQKYSIEKLLEKRGKVNQLLKYQSDITNCLKR